ncbi:Gfo/Idh/MocA family protein [Mycobacterium haemophilum]|uniref:Gfo/Idh/MocA-like oxidoreductase N-terminal domain-containing protein n=1 Tax=Mycobacterium haemophilum TaxID=29311 RepID=A0A0I9Z8B8_9MYCO|nr:Gfo/Idh/MocA family oxidoreductase [Mycobacterium haemophilum]KLO28416.1 hypothetical protein ABH39_14205 [Mycobacterium haemophilum]KLO37458.1 hypothetical protein ABH38_08670 [Mycobacterium haemophilum]KLO44007.1 hypothetical protein ABH37_06195 [Mycobacterium haemophilum]KLO49287.1 hypothetical protein ABH36_13060 [Mycobacterium haemophilum]
MTGATVIRIVLVGCGAISEFAHVSALDALASDCRVVAVVDLATDRRNVIGTRLGVAASHRYADVDTFLSSGLSADLAVVALPPTVAGNVVRRLLNAGLRVLTEKPFTGNAAEVRQLEGAPTDRRFGVIHNYLYRSDVIQARRLLGTGVLGPPRIIRLERLDPDHFHGKGINPHWRRVNQSGGCVIDNAYHWVYVAQELAGAPVASVTANLSPADPDAATDVAVITLEHTNGALSSVQVAWCARASLPVLEVHGEQASLCLQGDGNSCVCVTSSGVAYEMPASDADSPYRLMYRQVIDSIHAGEGFGASAEQCASVLDVLEAAIQSARVGKRVNLRSSGPLLVFGSARRIKTETPTHLSSENRR